MENNSAEHGLSYEQEHSLDGFIQEWGSDLLEQWPKRYGEQVIRVIDQDSARITQMWRTAMITVCRVRESRAIVHQARLENAYYGNTHPDITNAELEAYRQSKASD